MGGHNLSSGDRTWDKLSLPRFCIYVYDMFDIFLDNGNVQHWVSLALEAAWAKPNTEAVESSLVLGLCFVTTEELQWLF